MIPNSKIPVNITKQKQHLHLQGPAGARVAERPGEEEESGGTPPSTTFASRWHHDLKYTS